MDRRELIRRLLATFVVELDEHTQALERDLLALERAPERDRGRLAASLFREAHSLKGAAQSVELPIVVSACHRAEELLLRARDGVSPLAPDQVQLLLLVTDALRDAGQRVRQGERLERSPLEALIPRLDEALRDRPAPPAEARLAKGGMPSEAGPDDAPSPTEAPTPAGESPSGRPDGGPAEPPWGRSDSPGAAGHPEAEVLHDGFVRVPASKLDRLLVRSTELLLARSRAAVRSRDLRELDTLVTQTIARWDAAEAALVGAQPAVARGPKGAPARAAPALSRARRSVVHVRAALERLDTALRADHELLRQAAVALEDEVRRVRMVPFSEACAGLERAARDLARASGKEVELVVEGGSVELDRAVLDSLRDPLLHMVRNAVGHGVEPPAERARLGKPAQARVVISARLRGDRVEVAVTDDGRGMDAEAIRRRATELGVPIPEGERALLQLVVTPGFSTASGVTVLEGRGVGLDVVHHAIEAMHGVLDITSTPGEGARFVLFVPMTLATVRALLVRVASQIIAIPSASIEQLLRVGPADLRTMGGRDVCMFDGAPLPLVSLARLLGLHAEPPEGRIPVVVMGAGTSRVGVAVDELYAEQEVVVRSLGPRLANLRPFSGATLLASGQVALIVSPADIMGAGLGDGAERLLPDEGTREPVRKRLLVAEDSVTTRTLVRSILESAGYDVVAVKDGAEALAHLNERGADLLVADVEMPNMDGFTLTEAIRASARLRDLPVVLVTSLESEEDRARGLKARADAYLTKSAFDQRLLLQTIAQLL